MDLTNGLGDKIPAPIFITALVIAGALAIAAVILNRQLRNIPQYVETIFHETGHALSGVPFFGGMPTHIDFFEDGEAEVLYNRFDENPVNDFITTMSGYSFPILYGITLTWLTFTPEIVFDFPLFACVSIYIILILIGPFFAVPRVFLTLAFHACVIWLLFAPQPELIISTMDGFTAQLALVGLVVFALFLGSWRQLFNLSSPSARKTLLVLFFTALTLGVFALIPFLQAISVFLMFGLGVFLFLSGVVSLIRHNINGQDFHILSAQFGLPPLFWFIIFVTVFFPILLFTVLRVLEVVTMV